MISGVEDTRYIGILISRYLSWVLPLRCLGDMVHVVELPCGGLGHLPPGGEGAKIVDITNIERLLPKVLVLNSVILKHLLSSVNYYSYIKNAKVFLGNLILNRNCQDVGR